MPADPPRRGNRVDLSVTRLLDMLARLDVDGEHWPRTRLAAHYGVSERTITKDLAILEAALRIVIGKTRGGYALDRKLGLPDPDGPEARHPQRQDRSARKRRPAVSRTPKGDEHGRAS